ncbi:MAG TPA: response regulator [Flavitalea sp.]|nr:response regulator [Flavitalea sp.]
MDKTGPIIIIDDDIDDQDLLRELFAELNLENEIRIFPEGESALDYLSNPAVHPFIIISDIKMPKMDGFELKKKLTERSQNSKTTPFLFFTTGSTAQALNDAYIHSVQGIFQKPVKYQEWKETLKNIVQYWTTCMAPYN